MIQAWSGMPMTFGGVEVYITVYPPLVICLLLSLCFGWWWGAIPAYVATLVLALYAGMPPHWASLFAFADPLYFAVMAIGYKAIPARRDLRSFSSFLFYVQLSFVASIYGSSGALIWSYTNHIDSTGMLAIWQGWWLGGLLQSVLVVAPLMAWLWPSVERWQTGRAALMSEFRGDSRRLVLRLLGAVSAGVLIYGYVTIQLAGGQTTRAAADGLAALQQAVTVLQQTTWVFFWVFAAIFLFIAFLGYQLYNHWQQSADRLLGELHRANRSLEALANTDGLTGLLNRRAVDVHLESEWRRAKRSGQPASLVILDIDYFKEINDSHGHPAGDAVICHLAEMIRAVSREVDIAARFGGDEFLIVLPETDAQGARMLAERLREKVAAGTVVHESRTLRYSISLGVAEIDLEGGNPDHWLRRADQALMRAKQQGRNRIATFADEVSASCCG